MYVWCESFHGLGASLHTELKSVYGDASVDQSNLGYAGLSNFDGGQPGLSVGTPSGAFFLRMGPGITGNHNFSSRSKWYVHFAYKLQNLSGGDALILKFEDTTVFPSSMTQCSLKVLNKGPSGVRFALVDAGGGTLVESSSLYSQAGVYYLQLYVQIGASAESKLIVSGITQWDTTALDTQGTANATANAVSFWNSPPQITEFGNVVIADDQADGLTPSFDALLGDFVVVKIQPNAVGDADEFTPVGVSENWDAVNDYPSADDDSTYNETNAASAKDVMNYEDLPAIIDDTIYGVNLRTRHRKTEAGSRKLTHILKPTTIEYQRFVHNSLDTWQWFSDSYGVNPDSSVRYTKAEMDAHQFGYLGETV